MRDKLKLIDGTGRDKLAPRPHHGLIRALYDTVEACGGANLKQIKEYLPAAIDNIGQVLRKGKLNRALYHAVYNGYLVHDPEKGYWKIAPRSYYEARQEFTAELAEKRLARGGEPQPYDTGASPHLIPHHGYITIRISKGVMICVAGIAIAAAAFAAGRFV